MNTTPEVTQPPPVAWRRKESDGWFVYYEAEAYDDLEPLYTSPPSSPLEVAPVGEAQKIIRDTINSHGHEHYMPIANSKKQVQCWLVTPSEIDEFIVDLSKRLLAASRPQKGDSAGAGVEPEGLTEKAAWWAGARAALGLSWDTPRPAVASRFAAQPKAPEPGPVVAGKANPLIPWQGTADSFDGPLPQGAFADLKFRNGEVCCGCRAWEYSWRARGEEDDIVAYRITTPPGNAGGSVAETYDWKAEALKQRDRIIRIANALRPNMGSFVFDDVVQAVEKILIERRTQPVAVGADSINSAVADSGQDSVNGAQGEVQKDGV